MSAKRELVATVHVNGKVYAPGDDIPADVADQITNPKAWGEAPAEDKAPARKRVASQK